jgi:hypothetical protein
MRRKKYFDWEEAFRFIWENADRDGIWRGDAASLAEEFDATEDEAESVLDELRGRRPRRTPGRITPPRTPIPLPCDPMSLTTPYSLIGYRE